MRGHQSLQSKSVLFGSLSLVAAVLMVAAGCSKKERTSSFKKISASANHEAHESSDAKNSHDTLAAQSESSLSKKDKPEKKVSHHVSEKPKNQKVDSSKKETPKSQKSTRRPASQNSVYIVQIGAFRVKENAEKLHSQLRADGFPVIMRSIDHSKNGEMHLVRLEPTPSRAEAEELMHSIESKRSLRTQLITRPDR